MSEVVNPEGYTVERLLEDREKRRAGGRCPRRPQRGLEL